jgi:hypothetical protein
MPKTLFELLPETTVAMKLDGRLFWRELSGTRENVFYPAGYPHNDELYPWWEWHSEWGYYEIPAYTICRLDNSFHWFTRKLE